MTNRPFPLIEYLQIRNYKVLHNLELDNLPPLTVFVGPNGSGKTTILDALSFLSECFKTDLNSACQSRGSIRKLQSNGKLDEPISFKIRYRQPQNQQVMTYFVAIKDRGNKNLVLEEYLEVTRSPHEAIRILEFSEGQGWAIEGEISLNRPFREEDRQYESFNSPALLAANVLGQFAKYSQLGILRNLLANCLLADLTNLATQSSLSAQPQPQLADDGSNLPEVIEYFKTEEPQFLQNLIRNLSRYIPQLQAIDTVPKQGKRQLEIYDAGFNLPIPAHNASEGTLRLLAYLLLLKEPSSNHVVLVDEPENGLHTPHVVLVDEPDNYLHPRLARELAENFRTASAYNQVFITTHSPYFVDGLRPEELWVLYRDKDGFTQARRAANMQGIKEFVDNGSLLGQLWMENYFDVGDPISQH
jgi:predicted ATPase